MQLPEYVVSFQNQLHKGGGSGGFRGGKGGANAPPFGGVMYFCVHNCTSSIK